MFSSPHLMCLGTLVELPVNVRVYSALLNSVPLISVYPMPVSHCGFISITNDVEYFSKCLLLPFVCLWWVKSFATFKQLHRWTRRVLRVFIVNINILQVFLFFFIACLFIFVTVSFSGIFGGGIFCHSSVDSKNLVESTDLGSWLEHLGDNHIINSREEVEVSLGYIEIEILGDIHVKMYFLFPELGTFYFWIFPQLTFFFFFWSFKSQLSYRFLK